MIGKLRGTVDEILDGALILDVGGVGYLVSCSASTLASLPAKGEAAVLSVETVVREDMIRLFGFLNAVDRDWFVLLQTVQGVGAKVALAIQTVLSSGDLAAAVAGEDRAAISKAPGVGPRLAQRLVAELKGKIPESLAAAAPTVPLSGARADAVSAMANLGYSTGQAAAAVAAAAAEAGEGADAGKLLKLALRSVARGA